MCLSVAVFCALILHSHSFNIDTTIPVLRQGDQMDSYFGFSVAAHQFKERATNTKNWILVGAPKANSTNLLVKHNIVSPGAVYKCDLTKSDCEQVEFLRDGNEENEKNEDIEDKSNMWFGVSLTTGPGGVVLACGHRYIYKARRVNYHMYPGMCFKGYSSLQSRMISLYDECLQRNKEDAKKPGFTATHERYQFCQMGVSSTFIPNTKKAMYGGPGTTNFEGMIFYDENGVQYKSGVISYQGYSVSYGSFFRKTESDVVTGAPRKNHHGMVVVFSESDKYDKHKELLPPKGESQQQPGSGFGASVAGVDVNNDGWTDILVGAPYYSVKGSVNEGRVYVYMNKGNGEFEKTLELSPSISKNMAQFGHAVARVGDLDQDGYEDVAIGAPYEDKTGVVYVFNGSANGLSKAPAQIIRPSDLKDSMVTFGYSVSGSVDVDENGYPDLVIGAFKSNKVALLRSRPIIDIKANVSINPNPFDMRRKNCHVRYEGKDIHTVCMSMKICLGYKERMNKLNKELSVDLRIESDIEYNKKARVLFNATSGSVYNKTLAGLPVYPAEQCFVEYVFLRKDVEDVYPDITFRINYKMDQPSTPPTAPPGQLQPIADYAMLEEQKENFKNALLNFTRDCIKCEPNLSLQQTSPKTLAVGGEDFKMDVTVSNNGESAYRSELHVTIPDGVSVASVHDATDASKTAFSISHKITSKTVEKDNTTKVFIIPVANPLKNKESKKLFVRLSTGGFSKSEDFLPIHLKVVSVNPEPLKRMADNIIKLNVSIISKADLKLSGYRTQEQVLYGGQVVGESAMLSEEDIGNEVRHVYVVENLGPDLVPEAEIVIQWPYETKNGKHLLYLMEVLVTGRGECDFLSGQINLLNLKKKPKALASEGQNDTLIAAQDLESIIFSRKRRELQSEQLQTKETKEKRQTSKAVKQGGRANIILDCQSKERTARCTPIRCTMKKLAKGNEVKFTIRSRLWNGTFLEDYYGEYAKVISRASVKSLVTFVQEQNPENNNALVATQVNPGFTSKRKTELAPWVIPVAVVGAIIVLAIIIIILWKLGFFKRKKFDGNITDAEREEMMQDAKKEKQPFDS